MKAEEQRLDQASRLGSAKKRKPTKAERTNRMAAARAALERKLSKGPSVESESESEDGDKENELERANIKISGLQKNNEALRKKALYWKKNTKQLRAEVEKRAEHEVEKEEEEERLKTKREYEETLREEERLRLIEEKDSAHDELRREQKRRRVETDTYNETREQLERRIQDYQRQIHTLKAQVSHIPARLVTAANRVARTYNAKADEERTFYLKNTQGVISDDARDVFLDLIAMDNVPVNRVMQVFKRVAGVFGIEIEGDISE
ncbi:hypothetical protein EV361DRAFT_955964 [Lentinula raphanica]|nr:hypothetical protein EV361DRAFT_955964 [Lentinula raphanica]